MKLQKSWKRNVGGKKYEQSRKNIQPILLLQVSNVINAFCIPEGAENKLECLSPWQFYSIAANVFINWYTVSTPLG
jgi:hypothetical protein